jgi:membrane protease subunit (stomatin/prohibitin family)
MEENMFGSKKNKISFNGNSSHLISRHDGKEYKKGQIIEVPKGYEAILIEKEGRIEPFKNTHEKKLAFDLKYIYYVKSDKTVIKGNWGTSKRVLTKNQNNDLITLGAHGEFEYRLVNSVKFINNRINNIEHIDESVLTNIILAKAIEAFQVIVVQTGAIDESKLTEITLNIKPQVQAILFERLIKDGIELIDFTIKNVNTRQNQK